MTGQSPSDGSLRLLPVADLWNLALNNQLIAAPAFKGSRGYFPIEGDRLAAYDIQHGTLLWIAPIRSRWQPAIGNHLVFAVDADSATALQEDTGAVVWRLPLDKELSAPLVWDNGWLIGTTSSGTLLAFRAKDGGLIWRRELGTPIHAAAALAADRVYVPLEDGRVVALRIETGEPVWERRLGGAPNDVLALDDRLFVGSNDNYFYSIRARDGQILWRWATGADVIGLPVVDEQRVYFVSYDNILRALDRNTGNQRWKRALPLRPTRGPVAAGDVLLVSGISPKVQAYLMKDGVPAGEIPGGGELAAAPHVVTGASLPMVTLVTHDIAQGTIVKALIRSVEPATSTIAPLPNPVIPPKPIAPATSSSAQERHRAPHVADTR